MKRFGPPALLPVRSPFRLDFTAQALRRIGSNVVDVVDAEGTYYRALPEGRRLVVLAVRSHGMDSIEVRCTSGDPLRYAVLVARLLGTQADLSAWYSRARRVAWLAPISKALRGLKPPRYPTLWEACAHAIVFQQISIHAAAAIMQRVVEAIGQPAVVQEVRCVAFPPPQRWLGGDEKALLGAGLSRNKLAHLRGVAQAFLDGTIAQMPLEGLTTAEAAARLAQIRGIGPWSAAVVLLRGLGRLDTFPMGDSGVARSLALLAGKAHVDQAELLERLGPVRGMLYYHLLLGRLHNLYPP